MTDDTPASLGMNDDNNIIQVALIGIERTKEIIAHACVDGMISLAVELLLNVLTELAVTEETPATASRTFFTALLTTIKRQLIPWKLPLFASAAAITLAVFIVPLLHEPEH